jgi:hypothetical protein
MVQQENRHRSNRIYYKHLLRNSLLGLFLILFSLAIGILGYHHFAHMNWVDSYANAAMILSGMGPLENLTNDASKIFAGTYALFSGIIFLVTVALVLAPILHRFFHKLHLEDSNK